MKKLIVLLLVALLAIGVFTACRAEGPPAPTPEATPALATPMPAPEPEPTQHPNAANMRIALVEHSPWSVSHHAWTYWGPFPAIRWFQDSHGLSANSMEFFQPHEASDEARIHLVTDAILEWDSNVIIMNGGGFAAAAAQLQEMFPEVKFILIEAAPYGEAAENLAAILFAEEQAGFLAGYAAVMEGHRSLGFMGCTGSHRALPTVVRYGHGFLQGAEYAAAALGLEEGAVTVRYTYLGRFARYSAHTTVAADWFADGVEVIFATNSDANMAAMTAARDAGGLVIGADIDQSLAGDFVLTSAVKALDRSVYEMLTGILNGEFRNGMRRFDASNNGIGLSMENSHFQTFTQAQYDAIFSLLADGTVRVDDTVSDSPAGVLDLRFVTLYFIN